jgi:3-hydroxyisobutyrate dehydrogenase-like beta-hydroxyacid dehydrogenase
LIVSICPPEFAESMARDVAAQRFKGMYVDANAISPARACRIAALMACHEIVYVDGCVIGLPAAERGETWIYLSGPEAREAASCFSGGPLEVEVLGPEISRASALKMCFAAHTKGIAALRAAVLGTARQLGVLDDLDRQWSRSGPPFAKAVESIQHTAPKAWRFVAEMKEIAATFESAGLPPGFHLAAAAIFDRLASFKGSKPDLEEALQRLVSGGLPADSLYPEKDLKT